MARTYTCTNLRCASSKCLSDSVYRVICYECERCFHTGCVGLQDRVLKVFLCSECKKTLKRGRENSGPCDGINNEEISGTPMDCNFMERGACSSGEASSSCSDSSSTKRNIPSWHKGYQKSAGMSDEGFDSYEMKSLPSDDDEEDIVDVEIISDDNDLIPEESNPRCTYDDSGPENYSMPVDNDPRFDAPESGSDDLCSEPNNSDNDENDLAVPYDPFLHDPESDSYDPQLPRNSRNPEEGPRPSTRRESLLPYSDTTSDEELEDQMMEIRMQKARVIDRGLYDVFEWPDRDMMELYYNTPCDAYVCSNEGRYRVECIKCHRIFHTRCLILPDHDYQTAVCFYCPLTDAEVGDYEVEKAGQEFYSHLLL